MARILVVSPTPSHPQDAGNRARIFNLVNELRDDGHYIHFVYLQSEHQRSDDLAMAKKWNGFSKVDYHGPRPSIRKRAYDYIANLFQSKQRLPYKIDDWIDNNLLFTIRSISNSVQPNIVIVEYVFLSKVFELFGNNVLKILDTHDVFGDRGRLFIRNNLSPKWFYTTQKEEKKGTDRADIILAIQPDELEYFQRLSKRKAILTGYKIGPTIPLTCETRTSPKLLFVGSINHVNLDGIQWFIEHIFQKLRKSLPELELDIVGNISKLIEPTPSVNLVGPVQDLTLLYQNATVVINPLQFGTGLKIKTVEALAMRRPLVTTSVGMAGIENWKGRAFICADTPEDFIAAIIKVISSKQLQKRLMQGAADFIKAYNKEAFSALTREVNTFHI